MARSLKTKPVKKEKSALNAFDVPEGDAAYEPSEEDQKRISDIYSKLYNVQITRILPYPYFNDLTLPQYIENSVKRWNGYIPPRSDLQEDWQAHVFNNFTRNMVIAYLSKVALQPPKAKVVASNDMGATDKKAAYIIEKMIQFADREEGYEWRFFNAALESVVKGTVIGYEGYKKVKQTIKEGKYDLVTGKVRGAKSKEIFAYNNPFHYIVPLEEFYPANIWEPDIQLQPFVIWHGVYKYHEIKTLYGKYKNFDQVRPGTFSYVLDSSMYNNQKISNALNQDQVMVTRYYNRFKDEHVIMVQDVILYDGPIPFDHKMYPFCKTIFEPFAIDFFYGMSLPQKIASDQDIINTLWNMMLDQGIMSLHKPVLTQDPDEMDDTIMMPGLMKKVSNINDYRVMNEIQGPDSAHFNLLNLALKFANDNAGQMAGASMDFTPRGGKISPRQIMLAEENARRMVGLSAKLMEDYERQRMMLRAKNELQFWTVPERIEQVLGKDGTSDFDKIFYKNIRITGSTLEDGSIGTSVVRIADPEDMPSPTELDVQETMAKMMGDNVEIKVVSPDYIRNISFDIQIISESSFAQSKSMDHATTMEWFNMMYPLPETNKQEMVRETMKDFDKDPERFMMQGNPLAQNPMAQQQGAQQGSGVPQGAPGSPSGGSQMLGEMTGMRGARFGQ